MCLLDNKVFNRHWCAVETWISNSMKKSPSGSRHSDKHDFSQFCKGAEKFSPYFTENRARVHFEGQLEMLFKETFCVPGGADKSLARPGRKQANVSVRMAWISFRSLPCRKRNLVTARVSMLLKSRPSLICFRAFILPFRAKDLSATRYIVKIIWSTQTECV